MLMFGLVSVVLLAFAVTQSAAPPATRPAPGPQPEPLWLDVDASTGVATDGRVRDVDDGLAMIFAFRSPEVRVVGVSTQFGNATVDDAERIAQDVIRRFAPPPLQSLIAHRGAASADDFGKTTPATAALIAALEQGPLTIAVLGPATNVATVIRQRPDLTGNIRQLLLCKGRRPGFDFHPPGLPQFKFPDANFEKDVPAMHILLESGLPLVFAGYEASCDTWITRNDLQRLATASDTGKWIAETSETWLARWEALRGMTGFNPFDIVTLAPLTHPHLLREVAVTARITHGPDDRHPERLPADRPTKPYLVCDPVPPGHPSPHRYITAAHAEFNRILLERLALPSR